MAHLIVISLDNLESTIRTCVIDGQTMISVIDVIKVASDKNSIRASETYRDMIPKYPEILSKKFKFPGQGQRLTPVVSVRQMIDLLMVLPGFRSSLARLKLAKLICKHIDEETTFNYLEKCLKEAASDHRWMVNPDNLERQVQDALAKELSKVTRVNTEVLLPSGRADLVTDHQVIEVKNAKFWTYAMGQVIAYAQDLEGKQKRIHLFGTDKAELDILVKRASKYCKQLDILVTWRYVNTQEDYAIDQGSRKRKRNQF